MTVKYPEVTVKLVGYNGNVFDILARVQQAMKKAEVPNEEISQFLDEAMHSESYDHVLRLCMSLVNVE
jgi:hypothetical protein